VNFPIPRHFLIEFLLLAFISTFSVVTLRAGTLSVDAIAMFPKNTAEFAYANLKEARQFPWYAQFKSQTLPVRFSDLEHFLASVGVDDNSQIEELAWSLGSADSASGPDDKTAPDSNDVLGVALGNFDPDAANSFMKVHKIQGVDYRGYRLYPCASCDDLSVVFIDSSTVAFGHLRLLQQLLEVRVAAADSLLQSEKMFPLISQANGRGIFWGVLNPGGAQQALRQVVPQATQFPQASKLLNKLQGMVISIQGTSDLDVHFQLISSSPDDVTTISQLLQAGILLRQFDVKNSDPDLATLLASVRVIPNGEGLEISFAVTSDQLVSLIKRNTFSAKR
jgi:hypothetical protein